MFLTGIDGAVKRNEKKIAEGFQDGGPGIRAKRRAEMGSESEQTVRCCTCGLGLKNCMSKRPLARR